MNYTISAGDTAWMLSASALVWLMTPALGMFYGGIVGAKDVINTIMMSFICACTVIMQWILVGYSFALGAGNGAYGGLDKWGMDGVSVDPNIAYSATIPEYVYVVYQMTFAMITPAMVSGAIAGRLRFRTWIVFTFIWSIVVYDLVAHWVWAAWVESYDDEGNPVFGFGWLRAMGTLDFAGGTVVHMTSGWASLAAAIVVGKRKTSEEMNRPHNIPLTIIGATLLWFGWFGFNGGSAINSHDGIAALAVLNTNITTAMATLTWCLLDSVFNKRVSAAGACTGAVVGLVVITPACGYIRPASSIALGIIGPLICFPAGKLKEKLGFDDSLDVWANHGIGGAVGALLTGCFAELTINPAGGDGLFFGGGRQFGVQVLAVVVTAVTSFFLTFLMFILIKYIPGLGLRVSEEKEMIGMDFASHKEVSYLMEVPNPNGKQNEINDKSTPISQTV